MNSTDTTTTNLVTDPVCGMQIDPADAAGSSEYKGTTIYFCASACKTEFDAAPESFATDAASSCCGGCGCSS